MEHILFGLAKVMIGILLINLFDFLFSKEILKKDQFSCVHAFLVCFLGFPPLFVTLIGLNIIDDLGFAADDIF